MPKINNAIIVNSDTAKYPTHQAKYGLGGLRSVATLAERDALAYERCEVGMVVVVNADESDENKQNAYILVTNNRTASKRVWDKLNWRGVAVGNLTEGQIAQLKEVLASKDELKALATKAELGNYALKSEVGTSATYTQIAASLKYLGLELPTTLKAYRDYDLFSDSRLTGDLTITFTPIKYAGSYGQAWENVAIYNENDEKLVAKYATVRSDGLTIDAVFAKDTLENKGQSWENVPEGYVLLDGEVRATITLGYSSYYGASANRHMLNNNPTHYNESFLANSHNTSPWVFRFHNYKPSKFSITNGSHTYGGYGYMTKYNLTLSVGNWSKTLTYENNNYPNDIEINFRSLPFGSDAKTIELAQAWGVSLGDYNPNDDITDS